MFQSNTQRDRLDKTKTVKKKIKKFTICCPQETHFSKGHTQSETEEMEKDISCKWNQQKAGVAILRTNSETKDMKKDKEENYIMMKR